MTGPVAFEFEGRFDPALFAAVAMSVDVVTFGCRLNTYESEVIRNAAAGAGVADAVVVNTCAVTAEAVRQARQAIRRLKRERPDAQIVVTGCAAQTEPQTFADMPEVALVVGNEQKLSARILGEQRVRCAHRSGSSGKRNPSSTTSWRCARPRCTWSRASRAARAPSCRCRTAATTAAPSASSRTAAATRARCRWARWSTQVRRLVENGYREVVLTGVDITSYGSNLPGAPRLGKLVRQILRHVPELERLRISSIDSVEADADLLDALADEPRLMPHLHLSLQHGDDLILKRMKRRHSRADAIALHRAGAAAAPRHRVRRRHHRGLPDRDRRGVRALARPRRRMRPHPPARVPVFGAARHAGRAHAAGAASAAQGARGAAAPGRRRPRCAAISTREIGARRRVLTESNGIGRTEQFTPVRLAAPAEPGVILDLSIAGHDGRHLLAA